MLRQILILSLLVVPALAHPMTITDTTYTREDAAAPAFEVETDYYRATIVPDMGGRIVEWYDRTADRSVAYDAGYGGLLDDHGRRTALKYEAKWLKREADIAAVRLTVTVTEPEKIVYGKTATFFADRPVIQVDYHLENHGQESERLLFRNVIRPGGTAFTDQEMHCYSRVVGLQRQLGMPRTDDQADPWCAIVHRRDRVVIANAFEGDALERLYTWRGSKVAPTYEFMFKQLEAGRQEKIRYYWMLCHGLSAVDYAHRNFAAQVEGSFTRDRGLNAELSLVATWQPLPDLRISGEILNEQREELAQVSETAVSVAALDRVVATPISVPFTHAGDFVILLLKLTSPQLPQPIVIEKPFAVSDDAKLPEDRYQRPVRWLGEPVKQEPIPGWEKFVKYVIQPTPADRKRGYLVFEEVGENRGRNVSTIEFDMVQREPEGFPLHFHSLSIDGDVSLSVPASEGIALESFVPELVPQKIWGRTKYGLKLHPGTTFTTKVGEDRTLFFRLKVGDATPGTHRATIVFDAAGAKQTVEVRVKVHPIRFQRHPYLVFDVNNCVNYLCAKRKNKWTYEWSEVRARNYLTDMADHGVRGQTLVGTNAPTGHWAYKMVRDRQTGLPLPEAIKRDRQRFIAVDMPHLDFSEWDWVIDRLLKHGMTHVKWPMGGCGPRFRQNQATLAKMIYGRELPAGDLRLMLVQEWYYRELVRHLKDRGITRVLCSIDDEIPSEKLGWWVQHAYRCSQMGLEPAVTQSVHTLRSSVLINMVAPYMKYWIVGMLHKGVLDQRRAQGLIKPEHWVTTYHSSANHWRDYDQVRGYCGLRSAFFDLDACWIQVYWRWRQSEAIIYPGEEGPTSSAAWEGARDGLDDGNLYLLAKALIRALPDKQTRGECQQRLEQIVGTREDSLIRFADIDTRMGLVTQLKARPDTAQFRLAKQRLIRLVEDLAGRAPVQKANVNFGLQPIIRSGKAVHEIPAGMACADKVVAFLKAAAGDLALESPVPTEIRASDPYPVFFCGTPDELRALLPALADHETLSDIGEDYPKPGSYAIRLVAKPVDRRKKGKAEDVPVSLLVICGDEAGADQALANMLNVLTFPKTQYSHWLLRNSAR